MSRKLLLLFALVAIICLLTETHGWRRRRRRRRRRVCTRVNCAWKLGPCSTTCGPGKRTYIKTRSNSCGGTCIQPAAVVCNVKPCPVNCVVGNWQPWGPCSKTCGAGGVTYRHGSILVHPKHGGTLCPALKQWKTCNRLCLNNGSFAVITTGSSTGHGCLCKTGYSGSCCEINNSFKFSNAQINIFYKTLFIRWLHHPYHHHHSHHCGDEEQNFVEGENQDGDIFAPEEKTGMVDDKLKEEVELVKEAITDQIEEERSKEQSLDEVLNQEEQDNFSEEEQELVDLAHEEDLDE